MADNIWEINYHHNKRPDRPVFVLRPDGSLWINEDASLSDLRKAVFLLNKHYQTNWIKKKKLNTDDQDPLN